MFSFKQFDIDDSRCAMKVGTDGVLLGAWTECENAVSVIDAGCGSGLLSLMVAQRNPSANIIGIDVDENACCDARCNAGRTNWSGRIEIVNNDVLQTGRPGLRSPLLIISNPPFFNETLHSPDADRSLARHGRGFDVDTLISWAGKLIETPEDSLSFIAPAQRSAEIEFLLALQRLDVRRRSMVYSRQGRPAVRVLFQAGRGATHSIEDNPVIIRDLNNSYTSQYRNLTSDFYLHL